MERCNHKKVVFESVAIRFIAWLDLACGIHVLRSPNAAKMEMRMPPKVPIRMNLARKSRTRSPVGTPS
jgi:hypothetical protein